MPKEDTVNAIIRAVSFQAEYVMKNCLVPGQIENWVTIMDCG